MKKQLNIYHNMPEPLPYDFQMKQPDSDLQTQQFLPILKISKKIKRISQKIISNRNNKNIFTNTKGKRVGHWNELENFKYYLFLQNHHSQFEYKELRRSQKIFKVMANQLGTRESDQCRSHHQKMQKKFGSFSNILSYLKMVWNEKQLEIKQLQKKLKAKENLDEGESDTMVSQTGKLQYEAIQVSDPQETYYEIPNFLQPSYFQLILSKKANQIQSAKNQISFS